MLYPDRGDALGTNFEHASTKGELILYFLTHPLATLRKALSGASLDFFSTLLFLPALAPVKALTGLPVLAIWRSSTSFERSSLSYYYAIPSLILFAPSVVAGLQNLRALLARRGIQIHAAVPAAILLASSLVRTVYLPYALEWSPSVKSVLIERRRLPPGSPEHVRVGWEILSQRLPRGTSVLTQFTLAAYVAEGRETFLFEEHEARFRVGTLLPDYVLYDLKKGRFPRLGSARMLAIHDFLVGHPRYELAYSNDGYFLYRRKDAVIARPGSSQ
jgi:hypothetical protein